MTLAAIVATDLNNAIGKGNKLLCHLPADLKFFKNTTMGCPVVMGRKTYESIGRLLPGRKNIIITRNSNYKAEGAEIYTSLENCLKKLINLGEEEKVFIIGGAEIYLQSLAYINEIYRTLIYHRFDGADVFYPEIDNSFEIDWQEEHEPDEKNPYKYTFQKFVRKAHK